MSRAWAAAVQNPRAGPRKLEQARRGPGKRRPNPVRPGPPARTCLPTVWFASCFMRLNCFFMVAAAGARGAGAGASETRTAAGRLLHRSRPRRRRRQWQRRRLLSRSGPARPRLRRVTSSGAARPPARLTCPGRRAPRGLPRPGRGPAAAAAARIPRCGLRAQEALQADRAQMRAEDREDRPGDLVSRSWGRGDRSGPPD